jgi:hypothetical protein
MTVETKTWRAAFLKKLSTICLMLAMFFNPFGFDALFKMTMNWTNSYWITDVIFYCIAALFFGLYFLFNKKSKK